MIINIIEVKIDENLLNNKSLLEGLFFECHCALFLVDITVEDSYKLFKELISTLESNVIIGQENNYLSLILALNKTDLESEANFNKDSTKEFLDSHSSFDFIELSLKELKGIPELNKKIFHSLNNKENTKIFPSDEIQMHEIPSEKDSNKTEGSFICILIGDSETGKSSFLLRYFQNKFSDSFLTTIGMDKETTIVKYKDNEFKLMLWDTAGQERFKSLPAKYYQNAHGILLLFDVHKKGTFENVRKWVEDIKIYTEGNSRMNVYLIGNKLDLEREVSKEEAKKLSEELGMKFFESSVKINLTITEIMSHLIFDCHEKNKDNLENKNKNKGEKLKKATKSKKKKKIVKM